jgi:hypothetical protein
MANVVVSAIATFNGKALKKGQKEISAFDKSVKSLGRTFGTVFGAAALLTFSKKAVKAFAADQAAAKALEVQLKNTGFAFATPYVENYISNLQKLTGVLDDQLRPAFQSLLTATSSITLSQEALDVALNTSAATGKSLGEVTDAIVKSYNGQSKGLRTLGVALSKTALKTGNTEIALKELQKAYSGQAAARLGTYAGKMDLLRVAASDATEVIGKGLVDALTKLGKDDSIQNAADSMNSFALAIADTIRGLGTLTGEVKKFASTDIGKLLTGLAFLVFGSKKLVIGGALALIANDIGRSNPAAQPNVGGYSGIPSVQERIRKQEFDARKKLIDALKAEEALKKLKDKYDIERINLTAALNAATDEETKVRLAEKLAILDGNAAKAAEYLATRNAEQSLETFSNALDTAANATIDYFTKLSESLVGTLAYLNMSMQQILNERLREAGKTSLGSVPTSNGYTPLTANYFQDLGTQLQGTSAYAGMSAGEISLERARESGNRSLDVSLVVSAPSGNAFAQLVAESIQVASRDGYSTAPNGGLP